MSGLFDAFYERVRSARFSKFASTDIVRVGTLDELRPEHVSFMTRPGEVYKLRSDFTKSVIDFVLESQNKDLDENTPSQARLWYDGYVYSFDRSGGLHLTYELGLEVIPGDVDELIECISIIVQSYRKVNDCALILELSDARVLRMLTEHIPPKARLTFLEALDKKDVSELEVLGSLSGIDVSALVEVVRNSFLRRDPREWYDFNLPDGARQDLERIALSFANVVAVTVEVDFSLARTVEEYCGPTFALFDRNSSRLVAAGGMYSVGDGLIGVGGTIFVSEGKV